MTTTQLLLLQVNEIYRSSCALLHVVRAMRAMSSRRNDERHRSVDRSTGSATRPTRRVAAASVCSSSDRPPPRATAAFRATCYTHRSALGCRSAARASLRRRCAMRHCVAASFDVCCTRSHRTTCAAAAVSESSRRCTRSPSAAPTSIHCPVH